MEESFDITPLGIYNFRNQQKKFGIKIDDRRRHIYVIGKTGVGKTTLLENMAIADMRSGKGLAFVDPHGESAEKLLDFVPEERLDDVIYFDPSDMEFPIAFNPMEQVGTEYRHLVASGLMGVFKKIWADAWSARMQYILNNTLLALLENPGATLLGILRMFSNQDYRKQVVDNLKDPVIKAFWQDEFSKYSQRFETEALAAIQNKVGQFVSNPLVRNILGQPHSSLNMRDIMDSGKIFICNLSKGRIGEDNSALLGAMIITRMQLAAMSRVDTPEQKRRDFFLYVDEFQNFATESFANILSEARKYRLSLVLAHQYIGQLMTGDSTSVRDAVFGNVGTIISFRVGAADAEFLEQEFMPEFLQNDFVNLAKANIYIKLMIDGVSSRPFSAETLPPPTTPIESYRDVIIKNSRDHYGTPKAVVDAQIAGEWRSDGGAAAGAARTERSKERRLSEVLVSNRRPFSGAPSETPTVTRNVRDVEPRMRSQNDARPMTVAIRKEEERTVPEMPVGEILRPAAPEEPAHEVLRPSAPQAVPQTVAPQAPKKVLHPNVDIDALKRAITESLKKPGENGMTATSHNEKDQENVRRDMDFVPARPVVRNDPPQRPASAAPTEHTNTSSAHEERRSETIIERPMSHEDAQGRASSVLAVGSSPENMRRDDRRNIVPTGSNSSRVEERRVLDGRDMNHRGPGIAPHADSRKEGGPKIDMTMLRKAIGEVQRKQDGEKNEGAPRA